MPIIIVNDENAKKMHEDERIIKAIQFLRIVAAIRYNNICVFRAKRPLIPVENGQ